MFKKYLPYLILLAAIGFFFWIKNNQRGPSSHVRIETSTPVSGNDPFDRNTQQIKYTKHARCRMDCREIDEQEVKQVIAEGRINFDKVEETKKGKTYPVEGLTKDGQQVRIVVAPKENELVIVTVIDLQKEWKCDCY